MTILLDLGADQRSQTAWNPLPVTPTTFGERLSMEWERTRATGLQISEQRNNYLRFEREAENIRAITGTAPRNPYAQDYDTPMDWLSVPGAVARAVRGNTRERDLVAWDETVRQARGQFPDRGVDLLDTAQVIQAARDDAAAAYRRSEQQGQVGGGGVGGFIGTAAAVMSDPLQLATLPFGAGAGRAGASLGWQILRTALVEGGIAGATQVAVETQAAPYRVSLGLPADVGGNIMEAFTGGAVIGGGARALGAAWRWTRGQRAAPDGGVAMREQDSANVLDAIEQRRAGNPAGEGAAAAHEVTLARAEAVTAQGRLLPEPDVAEIRARMVEHDGEGMRVFTPAGRSITVQPEIVELRTLIPSHTDDGTLNAAYPHGEGLQPRERGAAPSQDQIREIAAGLQPERMGTNAEAGHGAPIVGPDQVVESGNGRILALRRVFGDETLAANRQAYLDWLGKQGIDTTGYAEPVLISRRTSALTPDQRRAFAEEANGRGTLAASAVETARADARIVDGILHHYRGGAVDLAQNAEFVRRFMQALPAAERGNLIRADGTLSAAGARRVRGGVLARAYGDEAGPLLTRFLEGDAEGLKGIAGGLEDVAGGWALMRAAATRGEINPGMDVTADLLAAVRTVDNARRLKRPVAEIVAQFDLDAPALSDAGRAMLAAMHRDPGYTGAAARGTFGRRLQGYVDEAMKSQPGTDMFGAPPVRAEEAMAGVLRRTEAEGVDPMAGRQMALRAAAEERTARIEAPRVEDAEIAEARRIAAARDVPTAVGTGDEITVKGARQLLDDADDAVAAAAQAATCLLGAVA